MSDLSWLNPTPHAIAVYASQPLSPVATQHSLPSGRYSLLGPDFHRLDRASFAWRTHSITSWTPATVHIAPSFMAGINVAAREAPFALSRRRCAVGRSVTMPVIVCHMPQSVCSTHCCAAMGDAQPDGILLICKPTEVLRARLVGTRQTSAPSCHRLSQKLLSASAKKLLARSYTKG
jgi:hypothetical protein